MRATLVRAVLRGLSTVQVRHVRAVPYGAARGVVGRVYRELERDFGVLAPPIILHAPAPDVLAATWLMLREPLLIPGAAPRSWKEAVSTAVSEGNSCPFCITMHSTMLNNLVGYRDGHVGDPAARAAAEWVVANSAPGTGEDHPVPFTPEQAPEMVGTAVILEYLNRMVNIFLGGAPLPPFVPVAALGVVRRLLIWLMKTAESLGPLPGASLDLLPEAPLPADLEWAEGNLAIAEAFARGSAVIDAAGRRSVPVAVRELVEVRLSQWDGQPTGLSRAWVDDAVTVLPASTRPAGRLALLTAFASYQIDKSVIDDFRAGRPDDRELVDLTSWASLTAARRVGGWMRIPAGVSGAGSS